MTSAPAIGFEYQPSRLLQRALIGLAVLAMLSVSLGAISLWLKLPVLAIVALAAGRSFRRLAVSAIVAAGWSDDGWTLRLRDHEDVPATLDSFRVLGSMVLLRLQTTALGPQVLLLAPDNSDADTRRRLRMRLATIQPEKALSRL